MRGINRAINQLSRQITDASKKDENLRLINDAQRAAVLAKGAQLTDKELKGAKDEAGKAAMTLSARKHLMGVVRKMLDIEQDIIDGKNDAAKAKLEELGKMRDKAHDEFGVKDEDEGPVPPPPGGGGRGNGGGGGGGGNGGGGR
jgi:hypothetical protein